MNHNMSIKDFIVGCDVTVSEAMQKIDRNANGVVFLVDKKESLKASLTDGDIRRHLLAGGRMDSMAFEVANKSPKIAFSIGEAIKIYHNKDYVVIPIVDVSLKIVDLYFGDSHEIKLEYEDLGVPVVINAGGRGSRLFPLTKVLPKPLIPIGDLPILELIMRDFLQYGCDDFHVIVNYKKELIKTYFRENDCEYKISWYDELRPLGTGGGLSLLREKFQNTFFFSNCDVLLKSNYAEILEFHKENHNVITMVCAYKNFNIPYGVVEIANNGIIKNMKEKPLISYLTNTGIYVVEPKVFDYIEDNVSIGFPDIIEKVMKKGKKVAVYPVSSNDWLDMGQFPELEKMRNRLYGE